MLSILALDMNLFSQTYSSHCIKAHHSTDRKGSLSTKNHFAFRTDLDWEIRWDKIFYFLGAELDLCFQR